MTTIETGAYIAALEHKLVDAERALYGFRAIFNNFISTKLTDEKGTSNLPVPDLWAEEREDECDT
jgi:hypothetical protein